MNRRTQRKRRINWLPIAMGGLLGAVYVSWLRPQMLTWGAAADEISAPLPGDEMVTRPAVTMTRAVTINAPSASVWPFIAQLGRGGTGWYAFDMGNNGGVPSYNVPRHDLPAPQPGMTLDHGFTVAYVAPERALVYTGAFADSWRSDAFVLQPNASGTRLIVRIRVATAGVFGYTQLMLAFEPLSFLTAIEQLNAIKHHAEALARHQQGQPESRPVNG